MTIRLIANKIKAIIFDFDGTLADSFPLFVHAFEYTLKRSFSASEVENLRNLSRGEIVGILEVQKWKLPWLIAKGLREIDRHQEEITIFQGISEVIRDLAQQD